MSSVAIVLFSGTGHTRSLAQAVATGAVSGAMLETWILVEILKSWWHRGKSASPGRARWGRCDRVHGRG